jgi:hypothetical protein
MIYHGMDALDSNFNPENGLIKDFDSGQAWEEESDKVCQKI